MVEAKFLKPDTLALHAGQHPDPVTGARAVPIYQTTSYVFRDVDHAASLFNLEVGGHIYSRISNPTVAALEERVAALEGGRAALAASTGMAAQMTALLTLAQQGDHIVAARSLYGGTYSQFAVTFAQFGIEATFVVEGGPELLVEGQPARQLQPGEAFQVPANTPHSAKNGPVKTVLSSTFIVEKGKPLASPA